MEQFEHISAVLFYIIKSVWYIMILLVSYRVGGVYYNNIYINFLV